MKMDEILKRFEPERKDWFRIAPWLVTSQDFEVCLTCGDLADEYTRALRKEEKRACCDRPDAHFLAPLGFVRSLYEKMFKVTLTDVSNGGGVERLRVKTGYAWLACAMRFHGGEESISPEVRLRMKAALSLDPSQAGDFVEEETVALLELTSMGKDDWSNLLSEGKELKMAKGKKDGAKKGGEKKEKKVVEKNSVGLRVGGSLEYATTAMIAGGATAKKLEADLAKKFYSDRGDNAPKLAKGRLAAAMAVLKAKGKKVTVDDKTGVIKVS